VVVTGVGLITSLGLDRASSWAAIRRGESGACRLELTGHAGFPIVNAPTRADDLDPVHDWLTRAADEAMDDARVVSSGIDLDRAAVLIGLSKGGFRSLVTSADLIRSGRHGSQSLAEAWVRSWPASGASLLAGRYGFRGPCVAPIAACATGLVAALGGADLIRRGICDLALAGGADASLEPLLLAAFRRMKALARVEAEPAKAVRPWDRDRSGFLIGEGAGVLVLERLDHALARGVVPYAELAGGALGSDAFHETALDTDPTGLARVIGRALRSSRVEPADVDAVNVHGTATLGNDPLESRALRVALGPAADRVVCSANKSQIGHLLGAAGSAELAIAALSIRDGFAPPILNLDHPDPACDLDASPVGRSLPIRTLLKLSLGFGGHLAAAVLRKV
jgi:3-oxoacyl-[acyl-carrier-protein] synthase II